MNTYIKFLHQIREISKLDEFPRMTHLSKLIFDQVALYEAMGNPLGSLKVVLQKDKRYVKIVDSGLVSAGLPCLWLEVFIRCRVTRQRVCAGSLFLIYPFNRFIKLS